MSGNYYYEPNNKCTGCSEYFKPSVEFKVITVQSINDFCFNAPIGVSIDKNGIVNSKISFEVIDPLTLISTIKDNLIISQGLLHIKLTIHNPAPCPCSDLKKEICKELYIPIQYILNNKRVCDDSSSEISTTSNISSFSVFGFPDAENHSIGEKIVLIIKVIVDINYQFMRTKSFNR